MGKFNDSYNNLILESYHRQFGLMWTESAAKKSVENMLKKGFNIKDILADFDNFLVPNKWFSFKKLFKSKPLIKIDSFSGKNCKIQVTYSAKFSQEEIHNLIYGKDDKKEKIGGIIYNEAFTLHLESYGFKVPPGILDDSSNDDDDADDDTADVSTDNDNELDESVSKLKNHKKLILEAADSQPDVINVIFNFTKVNYIKNIKARQMKNPNYIESFTGIVYLGFNNSEDALINLGTVKYAQSRYENMNPPKPIKDQIREMWKKPNKDFGIWGSLAQKGLKAAANGVFGGMFSQTVQEESLDINLKDTFQYNNNVIGGDLEKRSKSIVSSKSILKEKFDKKYSTENAGFTISDVDENKFKIIFKVHGVGIFKLDVESS